MSNGPTILLVEDDSKLRHEIARQLRQAGFKVTEAVNGLAGYQIFRAAEQINLVVTDYLMPEEDGLELTSQLRRFGFRGPIILYCSYPSALDRALVKAIGVTQVVVKDATDHRLLLESVKECLEKKPV